MTQLFRHTLRWPHGLIIISGWIVCAALFYFLGSRSGQPFSQGMWTSVAILAIGVLNTLLQIEFAQRLKFLPQSTFWLWTGTAALSILFGFITACGVLAALGVYFVVFKYLREFVFFFEQVYPNWMAFSILHALAATIYLLAQHYQNLQNAIKRNYETTIKLKDAQLSILAQQLNPHFLFNGLNNIRSLIRENPDKARAMLTHLSDILRHALTVNDQELIPLSDELDVVNSYMKLCAIQYGERLVYREELIVPAQELSIPPMMLQMIVENAVKYGIESNKKGGEVLVSIWQEDDMLMIKVVNPLPVNENFFGAQDCDRPSLGLYNIRERLKLLFGHTAKLELLREAYSATCLVSLPAYRKI